MRTITFSSSAARYTAARYTAARYAAACYAAALCCAIMLTATTGGAQTAVWSAGAAAGQLKFSDGSKESALGVTVAAHLWDWLDLSINPTYAWAQRAAGSSTVGTRTPPQSVSGFTDLPVNLSTSYELPGAWSPSVGVALGVTLPTGDTAVFGRGQTAIGANLSLAIRPADHVWLGMAAGRSLSNGYSAALASSSSTSLALSGGTAAGPVQISASVSGDVGAVQAGYESARSIAAGMALPVGARWSLTLDGSAGLTTGSPTWAFSLGVGTTTSGIAAASIAPYQRLRQAFGAGTVVKNKPKTGKP